MKQLRYNHQSFIIAALLLIVLVFKTSKPFPTEKYESPIISLTAKSAILSDGKEIKWESKYGGYTIVLVRHAEKVDESDDPELSAAGIARAERLAEILKRYKAKKVYATDYKRTKATINPYILNARIGLQPYEVAKQTELKTRILQNIVTNSIIVGHSNSIPALINDIAGLSLKDFEGNDYANLVVIKTDLKKKGKVYFFNY
ncbi:MAG TPA: phosphoglycerate mutase family protein [Saprospiraceae bacterium]|nr:phosphoglycerate mutase family protein [Saprospiraceae bacterium]